MLRGACTGLGLVLALWMVQGLAAGNATPSAALAGPQWRLVGFKSMDDTKGTARLSEGRLYAMYERSRFEAISPLRKPERAIS